MVGGWLLFAKPIFLAIVSDKRAVEVLHTFEQLVFFVISTLLLYRLLKREQARIDREASARQDEIADLQTIFDHLPLMIDFYDPTRRFRMVNQEWTRALGWTADQFEGRDIFAELFGGLEDADEVRAYINRADRMWRNLRLRTQDGTVLETAWTNVRLANGVHIGIGQDLTTLKHWQEALEESQRHIQLLINQFPITLFAVDKEGVFVMSEGSGLSAFGLKPGEAVGRSMYDVCADAPQELALLEHALQGEAFDGEVAVGACVFRSILQPLFDESGAVIGMNGVVLDVTSRVHAENELRRLNAELEARIAERTADLSAANERLTELDRLKSKFVAEVSHELRNPVASLNTRLYLLERASPEDSGRHIAILKEHLERLNQLINSVLNLSRIDLAKQTVKLVTLDLNNVIENELRVHYPVAESKGLSLVFKPAALQPVQGEPAQLAQVVMNLVANAINYTKTGTIEVRTWQGSEHVALEVRDSGIGIAEEDLPHVFERFYRGRTAVESTMPGTGLGLPIVKEIVDLHQGQIEVESEVGKGTTFRVLLPAYQDPVLQSQNEAFRAPSPTLNLGEMD